MMLKYAKTLPEAEAKYYRENDGLIDVECAKYPYDEPHKDYSAADELLPGIWHAMPTLSGDHGKAIGLFADKLNRTSTSHCSMYSTFEIGFGTLFCETPLDMTRSLCR